MIARILLIAASMSVVTSATGQTIPEGCRTTPQLKELAERAIAKIKPMIDARAAIAQQKVELSQGKGRFKGLFNPDYSMESLNGRDQSYEDQIKLTIQQFELEKQSLLLGC